jgi:GDP/UDP-N,N'-diacetylbacillosamine 2-epimerase (hydrolysing)
VGPWAGEWPQGPQWDADLLALGDRYEMLAAGQAAALLDIPVAHISGGDVTHGADDDWFRHCLTKISKLHFPSCEAYRRRVIRMGEPPGRVFNVGGLGDENIRSMALMEREALSASLGFGLPKGYALATFHPETALDLPPKRQAEELLGAVRRHPELFYLFTAAGADAGGDEINRQVAAFCGGAPNAAFIPSLGALRYLSAMKHAALVLGNSSSGVVETPSFGVPTVDVGSRQAGRETGANVLRCPLAAGPIADTMTNALDSAFARRAKEVKSPYNGGDTSGKIVRILAGFLESGELKKPKIFYDGPNGEDDE